MDLPPELLNAVAVGGKITLVVGAGSSLEAPTGIPLSSTCSQECHDRLVANGILAPGDCPTPSNLSALADAVVAKTGLQKLVVEQLRQNYPLQAATPNEGHRLAAALLREGAIISVLTLNFDLAFSNAISALGVGDRIGIVNGPVDLSNRMAVNLYYLHGNATVTDPEDWILRTEALATEWQGQWESVVATIVVAAPVVIFAGLGSPADVLVESSKRIRQAIPHGTQAYQVDPAPFSNTAFSQALALDVTCYVQKKWRDFMAELSQRLVVEHASRLKEAATTLVQREGLTPEDLSVPLARLQLMDLVKVGQLRANWLLYEKPYSPDEPATRELIADLLLAGALVARKTATSAILCEDGIVEFRRGNQVIAAVVFVSGKGTRGRGALEGELSTRHRSYQSRPTPPSGAIIAATRDGVHAPTSAPVDLVLGDTSEDIVVGSSSLQIFHVEALRADPSRCGQVAP